MVFRLTCAFCVPFVMGLFNSADEDTRVGTKETGEIDWIKK